MEELGEGESGESRFGSVKERAWRKELKDWRGELGERKRQWEVEVGR